MASSAMIGSSNHTQIIKIKLVLNAALNIKVAILIVDCSTHLSATLIVTSLEVSVIDKQMLGRLVRRNKKNFIHLVFNINIVKENIQVAVCSMWTVVLLCSQSCTWVTRHLGTTRDSWYWHKLCTAVIAGAKRGKRETKKKVLTMMPTSRGWNSVGGVLVMDQKRCSSVGRQSRRQLWW